MLIVDYVTVPQQFISFYCVNQFNFIYFFVLLFVLNLGEVFFRSIKVLFQLIKKCLKIFWKYSKILLSVYKFITILLEGNTYHSLLFFQLRPKYSLYTTTAKSVMNEYHTLKEGLFIGPYFKYCILHILYVVQYKIPVFIIKLLISCLSNTYPLYLSHNLSMYKYSYR